MASSLPYPVPSLPVPGRTTSATAIPLRCNICQKQPIFSDISHLLTHIASKGHLSTYYKIKVKSSSEDESRRLIDEYDAWYATWHIENLMSERMSLKETKKKQRSRHAAAIANSMAAADHPLLCNVPTDRNVGDRMDPMLEVTQIKQETSTVGNTGTIPEYQPVHQPYVYPDHSWHPYAYSYTPLPIRELAQEYVDEEEDAFPAHLPYSLTPSKHSRSLLTIDAVSHHSPDEPVVDEDSKDTDYSRLKGILWPGMDIFDSATPNMKRKRNQKKSTDVASRLEAISKEVEATEVVYSNHGDFHKARPITGFPHSDSSPLKGESLPSPKKPRKPTKRKVLGIKDINGGRPSSRKPKLRRSGHAGQTSHPLASDMAIENVDPVKPAKRRGRAKLTTVAIPKLEAEAPPSDVHTMDFLTSQFEYRSPRERVDKPVTQFRPKDWSFFTQPQQYEGSLFSNTLDAESSTLPAWDFLGQDLGGTMANPLFLASDHSVPDDDDEQTLSAIISDR